MFPFKGESFPDSEDFEDDIILTKSQKALIDNPDSPLYHDGVDVQTSAAMAIWPQNTVPYYVPPELGRNFLCVRVIIIFVNSREIYFKSIQQMWWFNKLPEIRDIDLPNGGVLMHVAFASCNSFIFYSGLFTTSTPTIDVLTYY